LTRALEELQKKQKNIPPGDRMKLSANEREIELKMAEIRKLEIHRTQLETQRNFVVGLTNNLEQTERMVYEDFVGHYSLNGQKFIQLCFCIFYKTENGDLDHEFIDFFHAKTEAVGSELAVGSNSIFARWAWEALFENETFNGVSKIYTSGDGGAHFKSHKMLYFWSSIFPRFHIIVENHFFPAPHGFNLCDSHGGAIKRLALSAQNAQDSGFTTAQDYVSLINRCSTEFSNKTLALVYRQPTAVDCHDLFFLMEKFLLLCPRRKSTGSR
jgi:hypothetical protein